MNKSLYLSPAQVKAEYGLALQTLANLRWQRKGPKYRKIGRKVLYRREDVETWLDAHTVLTVDALPYEQRK